MSYLYFDESIRDRGSFIVGALVASEQDLSPIVISRWQSMDLDPRYFEYKSSSLKARDPLGHKLRNELGLILRASRLGLVVCPSADRSSLGAHCLSLVTQLLETHMLQSGTHQLYVDQNIAIPTELRRDLATRGVSTHANQDSRVVAGLQVADHAAHALGGMLLEQMGLVRKTVLAGERSGYDPTLEIELGFELWARLRYSLIGRNEEIPGVSPPDDPVNPYFRVEGYGLYIAPSCDADLVAVVRQRFGTNYLGCIH